MTETFKKFFLSESENDTLKSRTISEVEESTNKWCATIGSDSSIQNIILSDSFNNVSLNTEKDTVASTATSNALKADNAEKVIYFRRYLHFLHSEEHWDSITGNESKSEPVHSRLLPISDMIV